VDEALAHTSGGSPSPCSSTRSHRRGPINEVPIDVLAQTAGQQSQRPEQSRPRRANPLARPPDRLACHHGSLGNEGRSFGSPV